MVAKKEASVDSSFLLLNFTWDLADQNHVAPVLMYQTSAGEVKSRKITYGDMIAGRIKAQRACIGFEASKGVWQPCPTGQQPAPGYVQCFSCARHDFFACRATCRGDVCKPSSEKAKELCSTKDTSVYLTIVANKLKVGVSMNPMKRWLDQGSFYGVEIYRSYGLIARRIENEIAEFLGITKSMQFNSKVKALATSISKSDAEHVLLDAVEHLQEFQRYSEDKIDNPSIIDLTRYYGEFPSVNLIPEQLRLGQAFSGVIKGAMGKLLLLENNGIYYVLNMKQAVGHFLDFSTVNEVKRMPGQKTLFEYF